MFPAHHVLRGRCYTFFSLVDILVFQVRLLRLREVEAFSRGHTASQWGHLGLKLQLLPPSLGASVERVGASLEQKGLPCLCGRLQPTIPGGARWLGPGSKQQPL